MSTDNERERDEEAANLPEKQGRERLNAPVRRTGMFGATTTGDTSGYGGLRVRGSAPARSRRPFTNPDDPRTADFDRVADALETALGEGEEGSAPKASVERVEVALGELTFHVRREALLEVARVLRDDPSLRYELCTGVAGVHFPDDTGRELHAVYHFRSLTHNSEIRVATTCPDADPHVPSIVSVYPTNDWHEREAWDFFGIVFDGHPALTRIQMPDDWHGHPQRKDYPLGGIPVEYRGATVPPPDERRSYK
ncbi:NADH-quinone oxidoreductase subunit C [Nocardiopsis arvandica]|uniref:NADH-quinone oxidoreductase subunit C n=1 Tax=Nocardiopsis sinuspersici TaxID=501010 RepID=A0A7Y9XEW7_9ACTN|nr:NADH-quinone oxidoreductase subunit C [Nocardiopsis sinuspersici]NYH53308.1 NADH-quinone oxidoreductase subunit C [Nocardiopsis sinuspersici]